MLAASETPILGVLLGYVKSSMTPYILSNRFHIQVVSDLSEATFLVAGMGYLTALTRYDLRGHLDHIERNLIEKWFQTFPMRIGRFHQT